MTDPFLQLERPLRTSRSGPAPVTANVSGAGHSQRKHSKFSASGAERWFACPGSVELSEGLPDKSSPWAEEGTRAHEVLEEILISAIDGGYGPLMPKSASADCPQEMWDHAMRATEFIIKKWEENPGSEALVETRITLDFIHPEMFGTFDGAVVDHFGTLHVFDYKYGAGHFVSPKENLQMIFYGLGLAHRYDWNFKNVRLWIIQPRVKGYDGPLFWDVSIEDLRVYWASLFETAVKEVLTKSDKFVEGSHCHWCKAKAICPLKLEAKLDKAKQIFGGAG